MQARSNPGQLMAAGMMEGHGWRRVSVSTVGTLPVLADTLTGWELTDPGRVSLGDGPGQVIVITPSAVRQLGLGPMAKRMRKRGWDEAVYITVWRPGLMQP